MGSGGSHGLPRALRPSRATPFCTPGRCGRVAKQRAGFPLQDHSGRIWIAGSSGIGHLESGRFVSVAGAPGGIVYGVAEDTARNIWVANLDHGLLQVSGDRVVRQIPWIGLGHQPATALVAESYRAASGWGFSTEAWRIGKTGRYALPIRRLVAPPKAPSATCESARTERCRPGGRARRLKNGRAFTLSSKNGLPCDEVHWSIEDDEHSLWLYTVCGLVRISRSETKGMGK